jgi:predicted TIM-barrel fold metal-dependent hydrolase
MRTHDLHQHLWPEQFVAALEARREPPFLDGDVLVTREGRFAARLESHDPEARARLLDRDGIDVAVLSMQTSLGLEQLVAAERESLEETWVAGIREIVAANEGRFAALSPSRRREGLAGVSVGSHTLLELDRYADVLADAERHGALVFVHPDAGDGGTGRPDWWEWVVGYPARMQAAYLAWIADGRARFPGLRLVFAMLAGGGPFQLERLARRGVDVRSALDPNTFFEVSTHGRRAIELCIETFGVSQLAYGSDTPVVDSRPTLDAVRGFGDAVRQVLQVETPATLLT